MKKVTKEILKDASKRLMLELSDKELDTLLKEFETIQKQMELIGEIEGVDEERPMTFPFNIDTSYLRDGEPINQLNKEEMFSNAPKIKDDQIVLPKVVK